MFMAGSMIGVQCQLVICRGHIRLPKNIFCSFLQLTLLWKNFSIFHDLRSDLKVLEMDWEIKKIIRGQDKHGLRGFNVKIGNIYCRSCQE